MANQIVTVNVSRTVAPAPSTLQRTGALISQGGTTGAAGTTSLLTTASDLTPILKGSAALTSLTWASSVVTAVTTSPHGLPIGQTIQLTISGAVPSAYNGTYAATITTTTGFTFPKVSNPGTETTPGAWANAGSAELLAMVTTFFSQGSNVAVYVLELGPGDADAGVAALSDFIGDTTPQFFYSYLVPRNWADSTDFVDFAGTFTADTKKTYFFVTTTLANDSGFDGLKCVLTEVPEASVVPLTQFQAAALFYRALNYNPSTTNKVSPYAFGFLPGLTPYSLRGNGPTFAALKAAFANWVGTGAEGGITTSVLYWGTTKDGRDFTYWYSVDWVQINVALDLANEIINGSNNPINPLYYNQDGINRLQARAQATMNRGISYGLVLAPVTVDAVDFVPYVLVNESDYAIGKYAGLSVSYTPARGFTEIIFNVNVTDFPTA